MARQLANLPDLKTPVLQQVWQSERLSECLAACDPWLLPWIAPTVELGDGLRLAGQRELLDRIGSNRQQQSSKDLEKAAEFYRQAYQQLAQITLPARTTTVDDNGEAGGNADGNGEVKQ